MRTTRTAAIAGIGVVLTVGACQTEKVRTAVDNAPSESDVPSVLPIDRFRRSTTVQASRGKQTDSSIGNPAYVRRKLVLIKRAPAYSQNLECLHAKSVIDYGSFVVAESDSPMAETMLADQNLGVVSRDDWFVLSLRGGSIDARTAIVGPAADVIPGSRLMLVQFAGPAKDAWVSEVLRNGVDLVTALPGNAMLVYAPAVARRQLAELKDRRSWLQQVGPYLPSHALAPELALARDDGTADREVMVTIQVYDHPGAGATIAAIRNAATRVLQQPTKVLTYRNIQASMVVSKARELANLPDVVNIEPLHIPQLLDERQGVILAGQLTPDGSAPAAPAYREWLSSQGLGNPVAFAIDFADDGLDRGSTSASELHPDFLDHSGNSRVNYTVLVRGVNILSSPGDGRDCGGHGTLNASIAGGRGAKLDSSSADAEGYFTALGIAPAVRIGSSRIFTPAWTFPDYSALIAHAHQKGARISSNSWGDDNGAGRYDAISQLYDALVRTPRAGSAQTGGMTIVFAAGNGGPEFGTISNLGAAGKNTISVGASENAGKKTDPDGCATSNTDADNAADIAFFSARGPCADGRFKPDLVAPGTRITGAVSQHPCLSGSSICGGPNNDFRAPPDDAYYPPGQKLYSWSSGTSHSCPAVAGAAALVMEKLATLGRSSPSPALVKAWLMNSARPIIPGDKLPSNEQGMGRVDLGRAFDDMPRIIIDQSRRFRQTGQTYQLLAAITDGTKPIRITLAWTDAPGTPIASRALMNDLDLRVEAGGGVYHGNFFAGELSALGGKPDHLNNVETVILPAGVLNPVYITITASSLIADGVPGVGARIDQDFALVASNLFELQQPTEPTEPSRAPGGTEP